MATPALLRLMFQVLAPLALPVSCLGVGVLSNAATAAAASLPPVVGGNSNINANGVAASVSGCSFTSAGRRWNGCWAATCQRSCSKLDLAFCPKHDRVPTVSSSGAAGDEPRPGADVAAGASPGADVGALSRVPADARGRLNHRGCECFVRLASVPTHAEEDRARNTVQPKVPD